VDYGFLPGYAELPFIIILNDMMFHQDQGYPGDEICFTPNKE